MASAGSDQTVTVDGRAIKLTNLDKVLYPATGTTKADVIGYYAGIASVMLPHLIDRPATRKRWPDGVGDSPDAKPTVFFNKDLLKGTPDWVTRFKIAHRDHDNYYPAVNDLATLTWLGQLAALEIHVPQWQFGRNGQPRNPDRLVLDLDPGEGVSLADCAEVARWAQEILTDIGHAPTPVTSGSKGIHLYAPLDGSLNPEQATEVARGAGAGARGRSPRRGHGDDEALAARRQGVHRLEPEQRRQDDDLALLAARPAAPDRGRTADLGGAGRSRPGPPDVRRRCCRGSPITRIHSPIWPTWRPASRTD